MRSTWSIKRGLFLWLLGPLFALGIAMLAESYFEIQRRTTANFDRVLAGSALSIADRVVVGDDGSLEVDVPYVALEMLTSAVEDRIFYKVVSETGEDVTGYHDLPSPDLDLSVGGDPVFFDASFRGADVRAAVLASAASDAVRSVGYTVVIAETTQGRAKQTWAALTRSGGRILLLITVAVLVVWFGVQRGLRPLERLVQAVDRRSSNDLRPIQHETPEEVAGLVWSINEFISRLEEALAALRRFTGNAGHQLRTPLSIVRANIELARRTTDHGEAADMLAKADRASQDAEHMVEQFLLLARVQASRAHGEEMEQVDLNALGEETARDRAPFALKAGLELEFEPCPRTSVIRANPILVRELLRNLINNAIFHASPGTAVVRVHGSDSEAVLEIEDSGPGMSEESITAVLDGTESLERESTPRTGIGLTICSEIAVHHGGHLSLGPGQEGRGLKVSVAFPT